MTSRPHAKTRAFLASKLRLQSCWLLFCVQLRACKADMEGTDKTLRDPYEVRQEVRHSHDRSCQTASSRTSCRTFQACNTDVCRCSESRGRRQTTKSSLLTESLRCGYIPTRTEGLIQKLLRTASRKWQPRTPYLETQTRRGGIVQLPCPSGPLNASFQQLQIQQSQSAKGALTANVWYVTDMMLEASTICSRATWTLRLIYHSWGWSILPLLLSSPN